ncbi:MAG: methyltransferase domain-containing protein [Spirochaetales bacterium]|nr:methyltransferase domain-containing protein [Spirochaetales bacterium]
MKKTDYAKIASKYDSNKDRRISSPDSIITELLTTLPQNKIRVLDLGCGTGNYLAFNTAHFKDEPVVWYGIDASQEMLAIAQQKAKTPELTLGDAHSLPYDNHFFDYVASEFAFHHFRDKVKVIDEATRVLKSKSVFRMKNLEPFYAAGWWLYTYFPDAWCEDLKRFWPTDLIVHELESRDFLVKATIQIFKKRVSISEIFESSQSRDISELNIISEEHYNSGLKKIEHDRQYDPKMMIPNEFSLLELTAYKNFT